MSKNKPPRGWHILWSDTYCGEMEYAYIPGYVFKEKPLMVPNWENLYVLEAQPVLEIIQQLEITLGFYANENNLTCLHEGVGIKAREALGKLKKWRGDK